MVAAHDFQLDSQANPFKSLTGTVGGVRGRLEILVLISVLAVAAAGVLLGLRYKAAALIAGTTVMVLAILAWNGLGLSPSVAFSSLVILILALQSGYIIGVWLAIAWRRHAETRR
jgi:hypothetical protein